MSNRDGLREHFIATVTGPYGHVSSIGCFEINTKDASRNFKARLKSMGRGWTIPTGTMTNLSNGRTLKIR